MVARGGELGVGRMGDRGKVPTSGYEISPGDEMYSMATVVNIAILYIWKPLREMIVKCLIPREKEFVTMYGNGC